MTQAFDSESLERFRDRARAIRERAHGRIFALLCGAVTAVCLLYTLMVLLRTPGSKLLWPNLAGLFAAVAVGWWVQRTRRHRDGIVLLAAFMMAGISAVMFVQRGSNAAGVIYGLTTVAVVFIAGFPRLGWTLAAWLAVWTSTVSWAVSSGRILSNAPNPFAAEQARVLSLLVATGMIGLAAFISQRRRRAIESLLEQALAATEAERDDARRLAERRARTVAELGHEIRTPMTGIVGATQLLAQQPMTPVQRQLLSIQRQSAERLLNLVTAVLDEAKLESGARQVGHEPYPVRLLVAEVTELFAPQAHRKGVEIVWTAEPSVPHGLVGDAIRVRQVLSNLVSNAVKFSDHGRVHVHLLPTAGGRLRVEVRDDGRGVAPTDLETIFQRFISVAPAHEQAYSTGLGLPLCREFARSMGGDIDVDSRPGEGSSFALELPLVPAPPDAAVARPPEPPPPGRLWVVGASAPLQAQLQFLLGEMGTDVRFVDHLPTDAEWAEGTVSTPAQALMIDAWVGHGRRVDLLPAALALAHERRVIVISSVAQDAAFGVVDAVWQLFRPPRWASLVEALNWAFGTAANSASEQDPPDRLRVLLVDDNVVNQIVGQAMLDQLGAEVVLVDHGQAAIDAASQASFDLILMDLQMPDMDGLEATRRLRRDEARSGRARTPVVAVSGLAGREVESDCREAGMDSFLCKPYTGAQLRDLVRTHCGAAARFHRRPATAVQ